MDCIDWFWIWLNISVLTDNHVQTFVRMMKRFSFNCCFGWDTILATSVSVIVNCTVSVPVKGIMIISRTRIGVFYEQLIIIN